MILDIAACCMIHNPCNTLTRSKVLNDFERQGPDGLGISKKYLLSLCFRRFMMSLLCSSCTDESASDISRGL